MVFTTMITLQMSQYPALSLTLSCHSCIFFSLKITQTMEHRHQLRMSHNTPSRCPKRASEHRTMNSFQFTTFTQNEYVTTLSVCHDVMLFTSYLQPQTICFTSSFSDTMAYSLLVTQLHCTCTPFLGRLLRTRHQRPATNIPYPLGDK